MTLKPKEIDWVIRMPMDLHWVILTVIPMPKEIDWVIRMPTGIEKEKRSAIRLVKRTVYL